MLVEKVLQDRKFLGLGLTRECSYKSPAKSIGGVWAAFADDFLGENPGGFDVGWIIQQRQRLLRCVGARPLGGAFFAAGGVENKQAGMQEAALPQGVEAAAIKILALVLLP